MIVTNRAKNTGTFDKSNKTWRIKGKGIQVSIRQLERLYKTKIEPTKKGSLKYWRRYLQDVEEIEQAERKANSPLQLKIWSLEQQIARLKLVSCHSSIDRFWVALAACLPVCLFPDSHWQQVARATRQTKFDATLDGRNTGEYDTMLNDAINVPQHDIDHFDHVVFHPDVEQVARKIGFGPQDFYPKMLMETQLLPKPTNQPKELTLQGEIDAYLANKSTKQASNERIPLQILLDVCGNIPLANITVHHFRSTQEKIKKSNKSGTTKANHFRYVKTFLSRMETDHPLNFSFIRNPDYAIKKPKGRKEQWTMEEIQFALENTDGLLRLYILLGMNCGMYVGDVKALNAEKLQDGKLVTHRQKHDHLDNPLVGSWLLWQETLVRQR